MKNLIFTIVSMLICSTINAQTDYYFNHEIVEGNNVVYRVDSRFGKSYGLDNITNTRTDKPMRYLNGQPFEYNSSAFEFQSSPIGDHEAIMKQIFSEIFTSSEINAFRNQKLGFFMELIIDPNGNLVELRILFDKHPLFYSIPPDKWYSVEQKMKQRLKFNVSEKGKTVQFTSMALIWDFYHRYK